MKRTLVFVLAFAFLSAGAFAASDFGQALSDQALLKYFNEAYASAEQTREALNKGDYETCIDQGQMALNAFSVGKQMAQKSGIKIVNSVSNQPMTKQGFQIVRGAEGKADTVLNPLLTFPDLAENILFAKVMAKKYSLAEALRKNQDNNQDGLVAYLQGKVRYMNASFQYVGDAFASWKGCSKALQEAYDQGYAQVKPEAFCAR